MTRPSPHAPGGGPGHLAARSPPKSYPRKCDHQCALQQNIDSCRCAMLECDWMFAGRSLIYPPELRISTLLLGRPDPSRPPSCQGSEVNGRKSTVGSHGSDVTGRKSRVGCQRCPSNDLPNSYTLSTVKSSLLEQPRRQERPAAPPSLRIPLFDS